MVEPLKDAREADPAPDARGGGLSPVLHDGETVQRDEIPQEPDHRWSD